MGVYGFTILYSCLQNVKLGSGATRVSLAEAVSPHYADVHFISKRGSKGRKIHFWKLFSPHSQLPRASHVGHAESAGRFLANLAMGLVNCRATPAPLAVFCHMDHMDMSQLHSGGAEAEICAVVAGES